MTIPTALAPGTTLSRYRLVDRLGEGGMGVVFRAVDTRLNRTVALKVVSATVVADDDQRRRLLREARAASAFNHPNIVTVHEVDNADGVDFIVMELVSGQSLDKCIPDSGLAIDRVLEYARQIASALEAAHAAGVVHRDVKPANVIVTESGQVKVLDFGIAKLIGPSMPADASTVTAIEPTRAGVIVGSIAYMSPEQVQGLRVTDRSDMFSFGVVLYEMLTGHRPFTGATTVETMARILEGRPAAVGTARKGVPADLAAIVGQCLHKDANQRPAASEVLRRIDAIRHSRTRASAGLGAIVRRPSVALPLAGAAVVALGFSGVWYVSGADERAARRRIPEVLALAERYEFDAFFRAASEVVRVLPDEPQVMDAWARLTAVATIESEPAGADVAVAGYRSDADWIVLGRTPLDQVRLPAGPLRLRLSKEGFATIENTLNQFRLAFTLDPVASAPEGMVKIPALTAQVEGATLSLPEYWLDRLEVTNAQFKAFVDAGGYQSERFWTDPFVDENGRRMSWAQAMNAFRDTTGRPGPATWELGTYLEGQAEFPVAGVSWYEAAAYARFVGKQLPTAFQWRGATGMGGFTANFADILAVSNFGMKGPVRVGSLPGLGAYGTYDMAGNVKEWCWNESTGGRMILGGGWNEPNYMFSDRDAQPPMRRLAAYGFRLATSLQPQPQASYAPTPPSRRDYSIETPLDDKGFTLLRGLYAYDALPLDVKVDATEDAPAWRKETVSFNAAYGGERVIVHLYLPKSAEPPFQTVVYFPGGDAPVLASSRDLRLLTVDFLIKGGRAVAYPVYKGTYERRVQVTGPNSFRDVTIARAKDFSRTIDFLETRADVSRDRIGYDGTSLGAFTGVIITALEPRLKASVLLGGGLLVAKVPVEIDPFSFAPRIQLPTLMINGRGDFTYPLEASQLPLFRTLGTPADRKRHALYDGGHLPHNPNDIIREVLDWFDTYLGPVVSSRALLRQRIGS